VIVGVGLLLFIAGVIWWRRRKSPAQVQQEVAHTDKPELPGEAREMPKLASTTIQELHHQHKPAEGGRPSCKSRVGWWMGRRDAGHHLKPEHRERLAQ
jgi:hypothetical protein